MPVILRDSTLREGLDTPGVAFTVADRGVIAQALVAAGVTEAEVVAPSRVLKDLPLVPTVAGLQRGGLIYSYAPDCVAQMESALQVLDRIDFLMPATAKRSPADTGEKCRLLREALSAARPGPDRRVGAGFPHSLHCDRSVLLELCRTAVDHGADRLTVYDTSGRALPDDVKRLLESVTAHVTVPVFFHGHNDLGLATANSVAAVAAGASGVEVTVNGLGDRAGNASLEQVAITLHLMGYDTGLDLTQLPALARLVSERSGVAISPLAPVTGGFVFVHRSPSHLSNPELFEAYDPALVGCERRLHVD